MLGGFNIFSQISNLINIVMFILLIVGAIALYCYCKDKCGGQNQSPVIQYVNQPPNGQQGQPVHIVWYLHQIFIQYIKKTY